MKPIWDQEDNEVVVAGNRPLVKSGANVLETTCGHMQGGVMMELITLKTQMTRNYIM